MLRDLDLATRDLGVSSAASGERSSSRLTFHRIDAFIADVDATSDDPRASIARLDAAATA